MLFFPNCKINLGLHVTEKRNDGFHNIETVFYPVNWQDAIEILPNNIDNQVFTFSSSGIAITGNSTDNLIYKAWQLISAIKNIPPIKVHLHKNIPMGAGLGGGSADAAFFINQLDKKFELNLSLTEKTKIASELGSDCAFFLENKPVLAVGKGNEFSHIKTDLSKYYILLVYPNIHSNTAEAYKDLSPKKPQHNLRVIIEDTPITSWKDALVNDFEGPIFKKYPKIKELKQLLYQNGAIYASLSGSGSTVFGIFNKEPKISLPADFKYFSQNPLLNVLI